MSGHGTLDMDMEILGPVWSGKAMKPYINEGKLRSDQIQPNGIDLTVDKIFIVINEGILSSHSRPYDQVELEEYKPTGFHGIRERGWFLRPGYYLVEWTEKVRIPDNAIGLISPRSTLIRFGGTIHGALWDRGYFGKGRSGLILYHNLLLEQGIRLAQMIFINATTGDKTYDGQYQYEQLNKNDTAKKKE